MRRGAFTLVEALTVVAVILVLLGLLAPSLGAARDNARLAVCAHQMHQAHVALTAYAAANDHCLPPFAFSDYAKPDMQLSGHWGGVESPADPAAFGRLGGAGACTNLNLQALVATGGLTQPTLICPSAPRDIADGQVSYFGSTGRFSTYCMRMPYSNDLFATSPGLANYRGTLMGIYLASSGGQRVPVGMYKQMTPLVRTDTVYHLSSAVGGGEFDPGRDALLSDTFWRQDFSAPAALNPLAGGGPAVPSYAVRWAWCHKTRFNVLAGGGSVGTARDDGTVAANSNAAGSSLADDGIQFATYGQRIWAFFGRR